MKKIKIEWTQNGDEGRRVFEGEDAEAKAKELLDNLADHGVEDPKVTTKGR